MGVPKLDEEGVEVDLCEENTDACVLVDAIKEGGVCA